MVRPASTLASWLSLLAILPMLTCRASAQEKPTPDAQRLAEVERETKRLVEEMEKLRNSTDAPPAWKEMLRLEATLDAQALKLREEQKLQRARLDELSGSSQVVQWQKRIDELSQRLNDLWDERYRLTRGIGVDLFNSRHAELVKLAPRETPKLQQLGFTMLDYPRVDGSTSTQPLATLIACRCFGSSYAWARKGQSPPWNPKKKNPFSADLDLPFPYFPGLPFEPEALLYEFTLRAKAENATGERLALIINELLADNASTHEAYVNLIEGRSDLGLLARPPASKELKLAREKNVELQITPCALDAFVILVNDKNAIRNLTTQQIRDIYSGKVRRWSEVGGADQPITPYQREENSGSQQLMKSLVMKDLPLEQPAGKSERAPQLVGSSMSGTYLQLTIDEHGLGYSVYYYERFMSGSPRTRVIAVDGVEPNPTTIAQRQYPYVSEVLVVTPKGLRPDAPAARLPAWLLSPEGQAVVRESGYVPR